ncbi:related to Probable transporter MCH1 [Saccharomycodes ludwigii]|uniref:Probable transporter MCH1 n=1 Tax=Saccharomycodes ludwigii TaxID=36035 RepID=A0A376B3B2_9ASCO|nr:hypothetical protein SCDLUD_004230 [Saccharomycodes ludwigii]KAH3899917.1 hypothetical protein SCDLUD_004230 [Saccharomycodes ludwigii]SSD59178.1 related to Probable transporter MCH1 [Saccharomycodes ludwigii]
MSSSINMSTGLSRVEHNLTKHIRSITGGINSIKITYIAYIISLVSCLSAGSVTLISLFTEPWLEQYNYTPLQINLISSVINMGGYLTPPLLGLLSDSHGPVLLSMISSFGFVPGYWYLSGITPDNNHTIPFGLTLFCFFFIGCSTSALFFSALLSCSKFYSNSKLLCISLPTTFYGISSIWMGYIFTHVKWFYTYFDGEKGDILDLPKVFKFLSIFYMCICLFDWISTSIVARLKNESVYKNTTAVAPISVASSATIADEHQALLPEQECSITDMGKSLSEFFRSSSTYLLFLTMFGSFGVLESYLSNMGAISNLYNNSHSKKVSAQETLTIFSGNSTSIRIIVGVLLDVLNRMFSKRGTSTIKKNKSNRLITMSILWVLLMVGALSQYIFVIFGDDISSIALNLATACCGLAYGGLFTIFPSLVLNMWGQDIFGTCYGSFMVAPALGSTLYGIMFAKIYESTVGGGVGKISCLFSNFIITGNTFTVCLILSFVTYYWYL